MGNTILKLAGEVNMLWPGDAPGGSSICNHWTCGPVFMNEGNRWWFNPHAIMGQDPPYTLRVEIGNMTIDCNKDHQSRVYKPFFTGPSAMITEDPHRDYPNSMYFAGIVAGGGTLDKDGFYNPFVRFVDANGVEGPPSNYGNYKLKDTGDPNSNALRLYLPPPTVWPAAAVAIAVYIGRFDGWPSNMVDGPTSEMDPCGNPRYVRLDPIQLSSLPVWDGNPALSHWPYIDILHHTHYAQGAVETQGNYRVPGRIAYPGDGSASGALFLDQASYLSIHDLEAVNIPIDGFLLEDLTDGTFDRIRIHRCGRWGFGAASAVFDRVSFTDMLLDDNESGGMDLEPCGANGLTFSRCSFRNNNGLGASLGLVGQPGVNISFIDCLFENNGQWNLVTAGVSADLVHLLVQHCTFRNVNNSNVRLFDGGSNHVDAIIVDCVFDQACGHPNTTPPYQIFGRDTAQITVSGANTHIRVINCDFLPFSDGTHSTSGSGIDLGDSPGGHAFIGNRYHSNPRDSRPAAALGETWSTNIKDQHFLFAASNDVLRACQFIGNVGDAQIWGGNDRVALNLQESAALVPVAAGDTALAVSFTTGMPGDGKWQPKVAFAWNAGAWWVTNKTKTGFSINWVTPPGSVSTLDWSV